MTEAVSTSETSVNFYQTTRRNIPEESNIHIRRRENLKSQMILNIPEDYHIIFVHVGIHPETLHSCESKQIHMVKLWMYANRLTHTLIYNYFNIIALKLFQLERLVLH
jgi:phosphoserine aminotransferase